MTNKIEYGLVTGFNPTNVGSFSFQDADGTDTRYHNTHYASISGNSYILDHPDDCQPHGYKQQCHSGNEILHIIQSSGTIATKADKDFFRLLCHEQLRQLQFVWTGRPDHRPGRRSDHHHLRFHLQHLSSDDHHRKLDHHDQL